MKIWIDWRTVARKIVCLTRPEYKAVSGGHCAFEPRLGLRIKVYREARNSTYRFRRLVSCLALFALAGGLLAAESCQPTDEAILCAAIDKSLPLLEAGAKGSLEHRKNCFTCHNQGLPVMALTAARSRGLAVDVENLQTQVKFVADFLAKNKANYLDGKGQGGQIDTAGYALWTLDESGHAPDQTTAAVAEYFLKYQSDKDHYDPARNGPPPSKAC